MTRLAEGRIHRHWYTVEDYYRMAESGILGPEARVELIEGEIVDMPPIGPLDASVVTLVQNRLVAAVGELALVRVQNPVHLDRHNEPEPDVALVRWRADHYRERHPEPAEVLLLVEVADSSRRYDREVKLRLYARFGIPETWLIDLADATLTRFRDPGATDYGNAESLELSKRVSLPGLEGPAIDLSGLL